MKSTAHVDEEVHGKVVDVDLHGKLSREDYERFVPEIEKLILQYGRIRVLATMHDFHGWDAGALWEDIKWNARHFNHIDRLAIVGYASWHKWITGLFRPFTSAKVRYFTLEHLDEAHQWVNA